MVIILHLARRLKPSTTAPKERFAPAHAQGSRMIIRRKSESPLATATIRAGFHVRSCIAATLAARMKMNRAGNVVGRLYFVFAKPKMNF
jgi:hypothetical protein